MSKSVIIPLLFILALGAFFRFYLITEFPLGLYPDEAMNGNNALEAFDTFRNIDISKFRVFYPENNGREGLFMNIQAISIWFFGNEAWALRLVSAIFGTLTVLGVYLLTKELFNTNTKSEIRNPKRFGNWKLEIGNYEIAALLSSFFLATSYWHINFSRIGFRAIMVPMLATFGLYFLLKGLRSGKILDLVWAGVFMGLGFHTYIAFRFMPFVIAIPLVWYLWKWWKEQQVSTSCTPCAIILFLFITFVVALPIGYYFLQNPEDFLGRSGQVSIFSAEKPIYEFVKSNFLTFQMFFYQGDCNWRHNFACQPELHPIVMPFFAIGFLIAILSAIKPTYNFKFSILNFQSTSENLENSIPILPYLTLLVWLFFMSLPATLTREGLPHALRPIGMIPPVMILAGLGAWQMLDIILQWFETEKTKWPARIMQLGRIQMEITILFIGTLLFIPLATYTNYFIRWAQNPNTYSAFSTDLQHLGEYLNTLSPEIKKYVIVNLNGVEVRGLPMPTETVIFLTNTFTEMERYKKNIEYLTVDNLQDKLKVKDEEKTVITFLKGDDRPILQEVKKIAPNFKSWAPSDFIILQNYAQ